MLDLRLTNIRNHIDRVLFPPVCFGCNAHLFGGEHMLCTVCRDDLPLTDFDLVRKNMVDSNFYGRVQIEKATAFLYFRQNGIVKNLLHHLKYKNQQQIGGFLGDWFGETLKDQGFGRKIDAVVPVPLHPKKLKKRGYNQVHLFAKRMAKHLNAQYISDALIKNADIKTQTKKGRLQRWLEVQKLYSNNFAHNLEGKSILLVDDVITTGATIEACAQTLKEHKDIKIYVAAMAVVPKLGN